MSELGSFTPDRRQFLATVATAIPASGLAAATNDDSASSDDETDHGPDWRMEGFDATNVGYHPDLTGPTAQPREQWRRDDSIQGVVAVDGVVYASTERDVFACDAETGEELWRTTVCDNDGQDRVYPPAVADGRVYANTLAETLYALDAGTGDVRWEYRLEEKWGDRILAAGDLVYTTDASRRVFAVDAETGREQWEYYYGEPLPATPVVADGTLYIGFGERSVLRAVDTGTGRHEWEQSGPDDQWVRGLTVADDRIYAGWGLPGDEPGHLLAIDAETGDELWRLQTEQAVDSEPAVANGTLYVHSGGWLRAVDAETGQLQWRFDTEGDFDRDFYHSMKPPVVASDTVYVGGYDATVYALDAQTGERRWSYALGQEGVVSVAPALHGGRLYVGSETLVALDETGDASVAAAFEADQEGSDRDHTFQTNEPVELEALLSRGPIEAYEWDITDEEGVDARGKRVEHTFTEWDDEFVILRVRGDDGQTDAVEHELNIVPWDD